MNIFRNGDKVYTVADIERLEHELVQANVRVKELEREVKNGIFEASCFDVDVIRCLNKMAYEHNEKEIPRFRGMAKRCAERISTRKSDLNNFAIEKKIEGAFFFADYLDKLNFASAIAAKESGFFQLVESFSEQLRKNKSDGVGARA